MTLVETEMNQANQNAAISTLAAAPQQRSRPVRLPRHLSIELDSADSATSTDRQRLESCIARKFDQQYQAQISHFLPYLLSLNESEQLDAVVGIRLAGESELFLESYLDSRVEQAISRVVRGPVDRSQVVEIGNLAAAVPGTASLLFAVLAVTLDRAGMRWVTCTATPQVQTMLKKLGFSTQAICSAEADALGDNAGDWGEYYASRPKVIVGDTRLAAKIASANPAVAMLVRKLAGPINKAAATLRAASK